MEQRAQVDVECPVCHWRQFLEVEVDDKLLKLPEFGEIKAQLEAWIASRCPEHVGPILEHTKN